MDVDRSIGTRTKRMVSIISAHFANGSLLKGYVKGLNLLMTSGPSSRSRI